MKPEHNEPKEKLMSEIDIQIEEDRQIAKGRTIDAQIAEQIAKHQYTTAPEAIAFCRQFIGHSQFQAMRAGLRGEESQFFQDKFMEIGERIKHMPKTYEQDGLGDAAIVSLHYFAGGRANFWITEKDAGTPEEQGQHQAFGLADLFGDGGEIGYISIIELLANGAELDLHFTPCTLAEIRLGHRITA